MIRKIMMGILACSLTLGVQAQNEKKNILNGTLSSFLHKVEKVLNAEEKGDTLPPDTTLVNESPMGQITQLKQKNLGDFSIKGGNYSGITWLGDNRYAVVSDKEATDGYIPFILAMDSTSGAITGALRYSVQGNPAPKRDGNGMSVRDCEGIVYFPTANSFFISGEGDQCILEYNAYGKPTGRLLAVPEGFGLDKIHQNYGFEALAYNPETHLFWTTTESTLRADGVPSSYVFADSLNRLRLQSFGEDLQPRAQYAYQMDRCTTRDLSSIYAFGVPAMVAMPDGSLLVMEREFYVSDSYVGSFVNQKIYRVNPLKGHPITFADAMQHLPESYFLPKELLVQFKTTLNLGRQNIANFEGMCLGPKLKDGRQTLLLISDSQNNYGNSLYRLKDYVKVIILPNF